jgi:pyruvate,water dikinase
MMHNAVFFSILLERFGISLVETRASACSSIVWFDRLPSGAAQIAGGKGASLSRMVQAGFPVPPGFVVCTSAFHEFLASCGGASLIQRLTEDLDVENDAALAAVSEQLRGSILGAPVPGEIAAAIRAAYREIGDRTPVAVRSSAASEDSEAASFAGQQETFLNVTGAGAVERHVLECWASFFTPRALFYRAQKGVLTDTGMAVVVQEMVAADKSGVMFTADPVQKRRDHMVIEAVFGLGEAIVSGAVTPDHYVMDRDDGSLVREFIPPREEGRVLTAAELDGLLKIGNRLEVFFGKPQDVEWCIRGERLYLLQSRPITTL